MATSNAMQEFTLRFEEERRKTQECLDDVRQLLLHATCSTRRQLIQVLQERIDVIQAEIGNDQFLAEAEKGEGATLFEAQPERFEVPDSSGNKPPIVFTRDSAPGVTYSAPVTPDLLDKE